jgi:hypothetical protein
MGVSVATVESVFGEMRSKERRRKKDGVQFDLRQSVAGSRLLSFRGYNV